MLALSKDGIRISILPASIVVKSSNHRTFNMSNAYIFLNLLHLPLCLHSIVLMLRIAFQARISEIFSSGLTHCVLQWVVTRLLPPRHCPLLQISPRNHGLFVAQMPKTQFRIRHWLRHWLSRGLLCRHEGHNMRRGPAIAQTAVRDLGAHER